MTAGNPNQLCQLYAVAEAGPAEAPAARLAAALNAAPIAAVLIKAPEGQALDSAQASALIELAREADAAALILDDVELARTLKADGVHLSRARSTAAAVEEARASLRADFIIGADAGYRRDDAMTFGERGADYIAFSLPRGGQNGAEADVERLDIIAWWAEIFELPSLALGVETAAQAGLLAAAGADFVSVDISSGMAPAQVAAHVSAVAALIAPSQPVLSR